jgi:hypothetical protein
MNTRLRLLAITAMVGVLALGMATPARAALDIAISTTNNPPLIPGDVVATGANTGPVSFTGNVGGFHIETLASSSNSPGSPTLAALFGSDTTITNNNTTTATIYITLGAQGFTSPVAPPTLQLLSHVGGTVPVADPSNLLTFQSILNTSNVQNATTGITTPAQHPGITGGSFSSDASTPITSLSGTYSLTEYFAITLSPGSIFNFSSSTTLTRVVPEPSTTALAGLGALGLIGYGLRRRKAMGA